MCAGTASVSLWALAKCKPLTGFMGSKRRDAATLCTVLDARDPDEVVLVDAGPWGDVWATLKDPMSRAGVAAVLTEWDARGSLVDVWPTLVDKPPFDDPALRVAQYLCLQARAAGTIPVWWAADRGRWESPSGARITTEEAHQRGSCGQATRGKRGYDPAYVASPGVDDGSRRISKVYAHPSRGLVRIATLADRVAGLGRIDWGRVTVHHSDVRQVAPIPGARVYMDPPYLHAPRYANFFPRADVLVVAQRWAEVAERVVVSEAEPLPLPGWRYERLRPTGKPEWLTIHGKAGQVAQQIEIDL